MRPTLFFRTVAVVSLVLASVGPAVAAGVINGVRVDATQAGGAIVSVQFGGSVPTYHLVGAGTPETSVIFDGATLGAVAPSVAGAGPITSISVAQTGNSSSVALHLTSATGVRVRAGGNAVFIDVAAAPGSATTVPGAFGAAAPAATSAIGFGPITEIISLKYADVSEVAGVLSASAQVASNDTFAPVQTGIGTSSLSGTIGGISGGGGGFNAGQPVQSFGGGAGFGQFGQGVGTAQRINDNIAIDRRLNAIVVSGTADVVAGIKALIDKIDIPVRSVLLETQIVELTDSASRDVGFDFTNGTGLLIGAASALHNQAQPVTTSSITANLYAQITLGNAKIIARPRILAQSGQQASILTGDAIPISTTVVSGAGTSSTTTQQINYVNVGVSLQIQPRVSSDGFVTSHIYTEVSSVSQFVATVPQISQRTAMTTATVRDGEPFIIGGLLQDNEIRNLTKLPFIGDLPLIGSFFRRETSSHNQTNLYIIITPHIVDPAATRAGAGVPPPLPGPATLPSSLPQISPPGAPPNPAASAQPMARPTAKP